MGSRKKTPQSIRGLPNTPAGVDFFFSFLVYVGTELVSLCPNTSMLGSNLVGYLDQARGHTQDYSFAVAVSSALGTSLLALASTVLSL